MPITNNERIKWFSALVIMTGASGAGGSFMGAPDRYTGSEGKALEQRVRALETGLPPKKLLTDVEVLKERISNHLRGHKYHE